MSIITSAAAYVFYTFVKFLLQALSLKFAVGVVKTQETRNPYATALTVAGGLVLVGIVTGFVPWFGWLVYLGCWCAIIMSTYKLTLLRSLFVGVLQLFIGGALTLLAKWVGLLDAASTTFF